MTYYSGSANDMGAVRSALVDACVAEGWAWNSATEVLSKGVMFLRLQVVSGHLTLLGRTSAVAGGMPNVVGTATIAGTPIAFPLAYEIFCFAGEVYLIINYNVDAYQWCAFGTSTVQGLQGSGMWVGASSADVSDNNIFITPAGNGAAYYTGYTPALFWRTNSGSVGVFNNCAVHSDLDGEGWSWGSDNRRPVGANSLVPLISLLPNAWNSEAVLLPIRAYKIRPSSKISLMADLEHARYTRVDNYLPGEIISIGEDRWKVFPWYRKNSAVRDGGNSLNHTGTFGWAVRYEGP